MIFTVVQLFSSSRRAVGGTFCFVLFQVFPEPIFVVASACPRLQHTASIHQLDLCPPAPREGRMAAAAPVERDAGRELGGGEVQKARFKSSV